MCIPKIDVTWNDLIKCVVIVYDVYGVCASYVLFAICILCLRDWCKEWPRRTWRIVILIVFCLTSVSGERWWCAMCICVCVIPNKQQFENVFLNASPKVGGSSLMPILPVIWAQVKRPVEGSQTSSRRCIWIGTGQALLSKTVIDSFHESDPSGSDHSDCGISCCFLQEENIRTKNVLTVSYHITLKHITQPIRCDLRVSSSCMKHQIQPFLFVSVLFFSFFIWTFFVWVNLSVSLARSISFFGSSDCWNSNVFWVVCYIHIHQNVFTPCRRMLVSLESLSTLIFHALFDDDCSLKTEVSSWHCEKTCRLWHSLLCSPSMSYSIEVYFFFVFVSSLSMNHVVMIRVLTNLSLKLTFQKKDSFPFLRLPHQCLLM